MECDTCCKVVIVHEFSAYFIRLNIHSKSQKNTIMIEGKSMALSKVESLIRTSKFEILNNL